MVCISDYSPLYTAIEHGFEPIVGLLLDVSLLDGGAYPNASGR